MERSVLLKLCGGTVLVERTLLLKGCGVEVVGSTRLLLPELWVERSVLPEWCG